MFQRYFEVAKWFLLSAAIFIAGAVSMSLYNYPFKNIGDLATWVGACGTFLAFGGTLWIAAEQSRFRTRQRRELAMIAAHGMKQRIFDVGLELTTVSFLLDAASKRDAAEHELEEFAARLNRISFWNVTDLLPLAPLPNGCSGKLAEVANSVNLVAKTLAIYSESPGPHLSGSQVIALRELLKKLNHAMQQLDLASSECDLAAEMKSDFI